MENEIWRDVVGFEGLYEVSSIGNVKSLNYGNRGFERLLSPSLRGGYPSVCLSKNGSVKTITIHILVAKSFIDSDYRSKSLVVNHKNFKRYDNRLSNLELVTNRENTNLKHIKSFSKYVGVSWNKRYSYWESRILVNGLQKRLGKFESEKEASMYYEKALICVNEGRVNDIKTCVKVKASSYKYISFESKKTRWKVRLPINNKRKHLGYFKTEESAYVALRKYKKDNNLL